MSNGFLNLLRNSTNDEKIIKYAENNPQSCNCTYVDIVCIHMYVVQKMYWKIQAKARFLIQIQITYKSTIQLSATAKIIQRKEKRVPDPSVRLNSIVGSI